MPVVSDFKVSGNGLPKTFVRNVWRKVFPGKPLPDVMVLRMSEAEWSKLMQDYDEHVAKCGNPELRAKAAIREWGRNVEADGCSLRIDGDAYLVAIRIEFLDASNTLEDVLEHELGHIGRGDCEGTWKEEEAA